MHLKITPSCCYFSRIDFGTVFGDVKLTKLQELAIQTGLINRQNLLDVLARHKYTLRLISITDFHLNQGSWRESYDALRTDLPDCDINLEALTDGNGWRIDTAVPWGHVKNLRHNHSV